MTVPLERNEHLSMAERTYTQQEVQELMARAAELQMHAARSDHGAPGLTLAELEQIADEAGLDPAFVRRAAAELDEPAHDLFDSSSGTTSTHVIVERWVPGELTAEAWEDIVTDLRNRFDNDLGLMMGAPGYGTSTTQQIGRTVEWRHTSMWGVSTRLVMRERGGGIRIRMSRRVGMGSEAAEGSVYGMIIALVAGIIAGVVSGTILIAGLALLLTLLVTAPLIMLADRSWRRKQHRELEMLADRIATFAASSQRQPSGERAPTGAPSRDSISAHSDRRQSAGSAFLQDELNPEEGAGEQVQPAIRSQQRFRTQ